MKIVIEIPEENIRLCPDYFQGDLIISQICHAIKNGTPLTESTERTGHWEHFSTGSDCSECNWSTGKYISPSKYCPNCGAKMVEPQKKRDKE